MIKRTKAFLLSFLVCGIAVTGCAQERTKTVIKGVNTMSEKKIEKTDAEWQTELTQEEYRVLRQKGTEAPGSGEYYHTKTPGTYHCAGCQNPLFDSGTKYHSGSGWPSFYDAIDGSIETETDRTLGMTRTEITCARCGGHLGHVFDDGPKPTGMRYCVNSVSLKLEEAE